MARIFVLLSALAILGSVYGQSYEEQLSDDFHVRWTPDYQQERVTFELTVRTTSYVGFGISPLGGMRGSDIIIGGLYSDGRIYFADQHVPGTVGASPAVDPSQDYHVVFSSENGTHTVLRYWRRFDTGDAEHDFVLDADPTYFIFAIGGYDPMVPDDIVIHHGPAPFRGVRQVRILDPDMLPPRDPCKPINPVDKTLELEGETAVLRWVADLDSQTIEFHFTVADASARSMSLGFSSNPEGQPIDVFTGNRAPNGSSYFGDQHAWGLLAVPARDAVQNYSPLGPLMSNGTHTVLKFSRPFDTLDDADDYNPISSAFVHISWAYGEVEEGATLRRGQISTRLMDPLPEDCNNYKRNLL